MSSDLDDSSFIISLALHKEPGALLFFNLPEMSEENTRPIEYFFEALPIIEKIIQAASVIPRHFEGNRYHQAACRRLRRKAKYANTFSPEYMEYSDDIF